jgi:hypothetical protein
MRPCPRRTPVLAAAVSTGWRGGFAAPSYRACRRPDARLPWDRVASLPARLAYAGVDASVQ